MSLEEIKSKALALKQLREEKEDLNEKLKDVNENIREIEEYTLSNMMDDEGITDITIDDVRVKRNTIFRGGTTKTSSKDMFKYLFDTGNAGALNQQIVIDINEYPDISERLTKAGIAHQIVYSIHHMTLSSILKELVSEGILSTEDFEKYNIYAQPQVKVEVKK